MLKMQFITEQAVLAYIEEQKIRQSKKYLTYSEREQLKKMIENPKNYITIATPQIPENVKPIIRNIKQLKIPCQPVVIGEDISQIVKELKATLEYSGGIGLSANQIGYNKQISYIKVFKGYNKETKKIDMVELLLINPKIIEHERRYVVRQEGCLSLQGRVDTDRWVFITLVNYDKNLKPITTCYQDYTALAIQHEVDHQRGKTIYDRKHKKR